MRLGLEIGGTKLQAALGGNDGAISALKVHTIPHGADAETILTWFEQTLPGLIAHATNQSETVEAIGIGFGGPVDSATGTVLRSHQIAGWDEFPLRKWFADRFELPVYVHNDSNAGGWAEYVLGAGRGTQHFCYMNIGSGIGGALVIDGRLHNGQGRGAAEIGHTYIPDPLVLDAGSAVKLEDRCSGWSIERHLRGDAVIDSDSELLRICSGNRDALTCAHLGQAANSGDATAIRLIDRVAQSVALALANVMALVHPERIAIGGGVGSLGETLLIPLRNHVRRCVFAPYEGTYEIVPSALGESVVVNGALLLAQPSD
jgi:glucokinase